MRYNLESYLPVEAFKPRGGVLGGGGMTLHGGGGGVISAVTDTISNALGTAGGESGILGGLADFDDAVSSSVDGGWGGLAETAAVMAATYFGGPLGGAAARGAFDYTHGGEDRKNALRNAAEQAVVSYAGGQGGALGAGATKAAFEYTHGGEDRENALKSGAIAAGTQLALQGAKDYFADPNVEVPVNDYSDFTYSPDYVPSDMDLNAPYIDSPDGVNSLTPDSNYVPNDTSLDSIPPELNLENLYQDLPDGVRQLSYDQTPEVIAASSTPPPISSEEELRRMYEANLNDLGAGTSPYGEANELPSNNQLVKDPFANPSKTFKYAGDPSFTEDPLKYLGNQASNAYDYLRDTPIKEMGSDLYDFAGRNKFELGLGALALSSMSGKQPQPQEQPVAEDSRYTGGYGSSGGIASPYLLRNRVTASNVYDYENPYDRYGSVNRRYAEGGEVKNFAFGGLSNALTRFTQPIEKAIVQPVGQALPFLKDVAPYAGILAAPFIANPAMAVGVGALSSGFGRPGTGFDMKRALMGGIAAYGASTLGAGVEAAGTTPMARDFDAESLNEAVSKPFFRDTDAMQRGVGNLLGSDSDAATKAFGTKAGIYKSGIPLVMGTSGMMAIDEASKMREEAERSAGAGRQSQADMLARIAKGKKRAEEAVRENPYMYAMGGSVDDESGMDEARGLMQGNLQKGLFGMGYAEGGLLTPSSDLVKAQTLPFLGTPSNPPVNLPANYQDARQAFEKAQQAEMENYRNAPYDPNRIIPGIGIAMIGNDQFGQQFGSATDAEKFNQFYKLYNQTQGPSAPVGNAPVPIPMPQQPGFDPTAGQNTPKINPGGSQPTPMPINNPIGGGSAGTPMPPAGSNRAAYESFYASQNPRGGLTSLLGSLNSSNVYDRMARLPPIMQKPMQLRQQFAPQGGLRGMAQPNRFSLFNRNMPTRRFAEGGTPRFLSGGGDGMSDSIKANIEGTQEARLADGEFVIPADVVSHLGNGSSKAGAKQLYSMMDRVRKARTGNEKQGRQIKPTKLMPA